LNKKKAPQGREQKGTEQLTLKRGWRGRMGSLRVRLIAPYLLLTLFISLIGMFIITRLVTSSIRERFVNQLLEASRVAADSIVRQEQFHLEQLRQMAFTRGVSDAVREGDWQKLETLLYPLALNNGLQFVTVADPSGYEILSLIRNLEGEGYSLLRESDLSAIDIFQSTVQGNSDELGDKFAGLIGTEWCHYLVTAAPIKEEGQVLGVIFAGTHLKTLLTEVKLQALADLVYLDLDNSQARYTTLPTSDGDLARLGIENIDLQSPSFNETLEFSLYGRDYQIHYSPVIVRSEIVGILGTVLPSNFLVTTVTISRNLFSLLFAIGTMGIVILGYLIARRISRPILRIRDVSLAVAAGDLAQRTGVKGSDEVGQMGTAFDIMTSRLSKRTAQVVKLYNEALERSEDLHRANTKLQQTQQRLVQSEKLASVGQLTAGIVHDVKTPLAVIRGLTEEAQEDPDPAIMLENMKTIDEHATRANVIVTDLLKFARQSNPEMRLQDVCETVKTAVRLTDFLARKGNVQSTIATQNEHIYTAYDAQLMEQVFVNLIQNAIQAMPGGGKLDIFVRESEEWVGIAFRDTGTGIPRADLKRIFDPFFTTKPEGEGTGLGLSVSYGIVAQHKGEITVESEVGKGTLFIVRIPKTSGDDDG
jgi:signal transduction histidine kinase